VGSLATVAVPKLAGELIDVCITYAKEESSGDVAKQVLNQKLFQIIGILAVGGIATGIRSWYAPFRGKRIRLFQLYFTE
jgi:hypothetical protein